MIHEKACQKTLEAQRPPSSALKKVIEKHPSQAAKPAAKNMIPSKVIQNAGRVIQSSNSSSLKPPNKVYEPRPIQDIPIPKATLKRPASKMQIPEYSNNGRDDRVQCRKCKRKFNPDRIQKHQSVCIGPINEIVEKPVPRVQKKRKAGVPLWKKQHLDFINNVRYAKKMTAVQKAGGDIRKIAAPVQHYDPSSDYKQCPYCSRKFNQEVAQRHIPSCKNTINKPKPPPQGRSNMKIGGGSGYCGRCGGKLHPVNKRCGFCG